MKRIATALCASLATGAAHAACETGPVDQVLWQAEGAGDMPPDAVIERYRARGAAEGHALVLGEARVRGWFAHLPPGSPVPAIYMYVDRVTLDVAKTYAGDFDVPETVASFTPTVAEGYPDGEWCIRPLPDGTRGLFLVKREGMDAGGGRTVWTYSLVAGEE